MEVATAKKLTSEQSIRKIVIDMNQKEISIIADDEGDSEEPLLEHFYEVIKSNSAFKSNRRTFVRKNSGSLRKRSGSDLLKNGKLLEVSSEGPKASMFTSQQISPDKERMEGE